jgi:hypothetical protein
METIRSSVVSAQLPWAKQAKTPDSVVLLILHGVD